MLLELAQSDELSLENGCVSKGDKVEDEAFKYMCWFYHVL